MTDLLDRLATGAKWVRANAQYHFSKHQKLGPLQQSSEAAEAMEEAASQLAALKAENERLENRAEVAEYKLHQSVYEIQPLIIARAERAEAQLKAMREALRCHFTHNPPGTDTRMIGAPPCQCPACVAALSGDHP